VLYAISPDLSIKAIRDQIQIVRGDITQENLGLTQSKLCILSGRVTHIIHSAAATQFHQSLDSARKVNLGGTENVMEFARMSHKAGALQKVAYISTAFNCGSNEGLMREDELNRPPSFTNSYEQSKWETENYVRSLRNQLPIMIFRPSIVVGDSRDGRAVEYNTLCTPLKFIYRGLLKSLPCSPDTALDVVSADFVAESIYHIFFKSHSALRKTFNIVAGSDNTISVRDLATQAINHFNRRSNSKRHSHLQFVAPDLPSSTRLSALLKMYAPYLCAQRTFDDLNTRVALAGTNISPRTPSEFLSVILERCMECDWDKQLKHAA
jgi:thioester reductase-like protein